MSEAADKTEVDDKNPIDKEIEEGAAATAGSEGQAEDTAEEIRVAKLMGWKPEDQWKGDKSNWKPARDFLSEVPEIMRNTRKANERLSGQVTRIVAQVAKLDRVQQRQMDADQEAALEAAIEAGDKEGAKKILAQAKASSAKEPNEPAAFTAFKDRNDWYGVDDEATALVEVLDRRFVQQAGGAANVDPEAHFKKIEAGVKRAFPALFDGGGDDERETQQRDGRRAPLVARGTRAERPRSNGQITAADLSPAQRNAIKIMGVSEADYVKNFNLLNKAS